jgi:hypothetical protein
MNSIPKIQGQESISKRLAKSFSKGDLAIIKGKKTASNKLCK